MSKNHPSHLFETEHHVLQPVSCCLGTIEHLEDPEEIWDNGQVLRELAVLFGFQSLCNGKIQDLSQVLVGTVCETGQSQLAKLKFWMQNFEETTTEAF